MNGALGSMLTMFPEAKVPVQYFNMQPVNGSGWGPRTDVRNFSGVLQCTGGRRVKDSHGNLVIERQMRFWTSEDLQVGWFIDDGQYVYRLGIPDNSWTNEAGFTVYDCERVVGNDGTETVEPPFQQGGGAVIA